MTRPLALALALVVALTATAAPAQPADATTRHLLAGVSAFRDGRYPDALVEFRLVERAPSPPAELAFYLGPTLYKLGRHREALEVFLASTARRDELTDFYLATTFHQLRLYGAALDLFRAVRTRNLGPKLKDAADSYATRIEALFRTPPTAGDIARHVADAEDALGRGQLYASAAFLHEASRVAALRATTTDGQSLHRALAGALEAARGCLERGEQGKARALLQAVALAPAETGREAKRLLQEIPR